MSITHIFSFSRRSFEDVPVPADTAFTSSESSPPVIIEVKSNPVLWI